MTEREEGVDDDVSDWMMMFMDDVLLFLFSVPTKGSSDLTQISSPRRVAQALGAA